MLAVIVVGNETVKNLLMNVEGKSGKTFFKSMTEENMFANVQGVWLGTLDMTMTAGDIVSRIFGKGNFRNEWEENSWNSEEVNGSEKTRLISLRNMVYLGCILGAIEQKVGKVAKENGIDYNSARVSIAVPTSANDDAFILDVKDAMPGLIGFNSNFILYKVRLEWIGKLMEWLTDIESGFVHDFKLGVNSIDRKLLFEKQCLTDLKLQISPDMLTEITDLYDKIYSYIQVKVEAR